jgi:hypothetical protein
MALVGLLALAPLAGSCAVHGQHAAPPERGAPEEATTHSTETPESEVPLHFVSDQSDLKLHVRVEDESGHEHYAEVCTAPCDTTIAPDQYRLALSLPGDDPVESRKSFTLRGPSTVRGHYESRGVLSFVLLLSELPLAFAAIFLWAEANADHGVVCGYQPPTDFSSGGQVCHPKGPDNGLLAASELTGGLGTTVAVAWFLLHGDRATIEVVPLAGLPHFKDARFERGRGPDGPKGLTLRIRF